MRNWRVIIVEDEAAARRRLLRFMEQRPQFEVLATAASGQEAIAIICKNQPDLLILDIELKDMTAFDVIAQLPQTYAGKIIFLTAFDQYAIKAFEVFALDYILKPFDENRLQTSLQRLQQTSRNDVKTVRDNLSSFIILEHKISLPEGKTQHIFEEDSIVWIEAEGYHIRLHFSDRHTQLLRITLKESLQYLPDFFLRLNRSQVINLKYVASKTVYKTEERYKLLNGKTFIRTKNYLS